MRIYIFAAAAILASTASTTHANPIYAVTDLGRTIPLPDGLGIARLGTTSSGVGYVTNTSGTPVAEFDRSSISLPSTWTPDAGLIKDFPAGTPIFGGVRNSSGLILGGSGVDHKSYLFDPGTSNLVKLPNANSGPPNTVFDYSYGDINSLNMLLVNRWRGDYTLIDKHNVIGSRVYRGVPPTGYELHYIKNISLYDLKTGAFTDITSAIQSELGVLIDGAGSIDDLGRILATGLRDGEEHDFLLTPQGLSNVLPTPEPNALWPLGLGSAALMVRRIRNRRRA